MGSDLEPDVRNEASNEIRDQYLDAAQGTNGARLASAPFTLDDRACAATRRLVPRS